MIDTAPTGEVEQDANEMAQGELAANTVPTPDDVLQDVGPLAVLWYARELAYYAVKSWAAQLSLTDHDDIHAESELSEALQGISLAAGNLDAACILVSLLPPDYADDAT